MYLIIPDTAVSEQVAALPTEALASYAQMLEVLQLAPWKGRTGSLSTKLTRTRLSGAGRSDPARPGQVIYLILEEQQEVHLLLVQWWG